MCVSVFGNYLYIDNLIQACDIVIFCFFEAEDGIRDLVRFRGLGDVYKRQPEEGSSRDRQGEGLGRQSEAQAQASGTVKAVGCGG